MSIQLTCPHCQNTGNYNPKKILEQQKTVYRKDQPGVGEQYDENVMRGGQPGEVYVPKEDIPDQIVVCCQYCAELFKIAKDDFEPALRKMNLLGGT